MKTLRTIHSRNFTKRSWTNLDFLDVVVGQGDLSQERSSLEDLLVDAGEAIVREPQKKEWSTSERARSDFLKVERLRRPSLFLRYSNSVALKIEVLQTLQSGKGLRSDFFHVVEGEIDDLISLF